MISKMYSIFDSATRAYMQPFCVDTDEVAIRAFTTHVNDPNHPFGQHAKDYTLFLIGKFNSDNAKIELPQSPKPLGNGLSFIINSTDDDQLDILKEVK